MYYYVYYYYTTVFEEALSIKNVSRIICIHILDI